MLQSETDEHLLEQYAKAGCEEAFARLVAAHVDMVYSASLRQVGRSDLAEEVTQAVFIILARKASKLPTGTVVAAWLHRTARYTAMNALKVEARRRRHEKEAAAMNADLWRANASWNRLSPLLDEAVDRLPLADREAITLRFLQQMSLADVGHAMGVSENAAQMRVSRALEKLRGFFKRKGVELPAAAIGGVMLANAVKAAPPPLASGLSTVALSSANPAVAAGKVAKIADATVKAMAADKARATAALILTSLICLCLGVWLTYSILTRGFFGPRQEQRSVEQVRWEGVEQGSARGRLAGPEATPASG